MRWYKVHFTEEESRRGGLDSFRIVAEGRFHDTGEPSDFAVYSARDVLGNTICVSEEALRHLTGESPEWVFTECEEPKGFHMDPVCGYELLQDRLGDVRLQP